MDGPAFDNLLRSFARGLSRRTTLAALASAVFTGGSHALLRDAEARNKHKRKKKKHKGRRRVQCQSGATNCGGQCFNLNDNAQHCGGCNTSCGNGTTCVNGTCRCPSGSKHCEGECIPAGQCCGTCPGDKVCVDGSCACPANAPIECPGDSCVSEGQCCVSAECPAGFACVDGICLCQAAGAINCNAVCCDRSTEVCKLEVVGGEVRASCPPGSCPPTNFCTDRQTEQFICANDLQRVCVCTSTTDLIPGSVCVDFNLLVDNNPCETCDTSSDCGSGRVCIAGGDGCVCGANFCVPLCP